MPQGKFSRKYNPQSGWSPILHHSRASSPCSPVSVAFKALLCWTFLPVLPGANAPPHPPAFHPLKMTCFLLLMPHTLECSPDPLSISETHQGTRILWNWDQKQLPLERFFLRLTLSLHCSILPLPLNDSSSPLRPAVPCATLWYSTCHAVLWLRHNSD